MSETATRPHWPMVTRLIIGLLVLAFGIFPLVESTATPLPPPDPQWWRRRPHH